MKSFHIEAYTFCADNVCTDCVANWAKQELMKEGYTPKTIEDIAFYEGPDYDCGVFAYRSEGLLKVLAPLRNIDVSNEFSYDSDDFPKVIFADQVEEDFYCGWCLNEGSN